MPVDADQGLSQKIFYFHVPIALTAYACFGWGAWKALRHLWKRQEGADLESYVAIHLGVIFGAMTLLTGSIWARASWGVWWAWSSKQLVLFLVLFLFYCAYFMLRFSVEPGPRRANLSAVYALFGVVLIPISFLAIRLAEDFIHPTVFTSNGPQMSAARCSSRSASRGRDARRPRRALPSRARRASGSTRACASCGSCSHDLAARSTLLPRTSSCSLTLLVYVVIIASKLQRLEASARRPASSESARPRG